MNPFFFGESDQPLFGVYHPPRGQADLRRGVALCAPMGQEYMRSHRAYRTLANLLSRRGLHVFRFDYYGTGDSSGDSEAGSPGVWQQNIGQAVDELRDNGALERVSLVGLRFGGSLALLEASRRDDIERVVLWDPVISGAAYIREMLEVADPPAPDTPGSGTVGVLGFPLTTGMRDQIEKVDLMKLESPNVDAISILVSSESEPVQMLREHLASSGAQVSCECIHSAGEWNEVDNFGGALVPQEIMQGVVACLTE